jgi:hypothetical protein
MKIKHQGISAITNIFSSANLREIGKIFMLCLLTSALSISYALCTNRLSLVPRSTELSGGKIAAYRALEKPVGFTNPGNCCFIITALQLLFMNEHVCNYLLSVPTSRNKTLVTQILREVLLKRNARNGNIGNEILQIYNALQKDSINQASGIPPNDMCLFYMDLYNRIINESSAKLADQERFALQHHLQFSLRQKLIDKEKKFISYVYKTEGIIVTDIPNTPSNLEPLANNYFAPCERTEYTTYSDFNGNELPDYLTIYTPLTSNYFGLTFNDTINLNKLPYEIIGIGARNGASCNSGHFRTYCKDNQNWYHINDANVKKIETPAEWEKEKKLQLFGNIAPNEKKLSRACMFILKRLK